MRYAYPVALERDEDGRVVAMCPDVPDALTDGANEAEALLEMRNALAAALAGYARADRPLPESSDVAPGQHLVPVPTLVAAKLSLSAAMKRRGITNVELARRLGVTEAVIRRLVDPDHHSKIERVTDALTAVGEFLIVEDRQSEAA